MRIIAHTLHVHAEDRRVDGTHWDGLADVVLHGIHDATTDDQTVAANCRNEETKRVLVGPGAATSRAASVGK